MRAHGLDLSTFERKEASSEKLQARRDHRFVWEAREGDRRNVDELRFRCEVKIAGDRPAYLRRYAKIPETWEREREESNTLRAILKGISAILFVAIGLHLIWILIRQIRGDGLTWMPAFKLALAGGLIFTVNFFNSLPTLQSVYPTQISQTIFSIYQAGGFFLGLLGMGLMLVLATALASTLYPDWRTRLKTANRVQFMRDALLVTALLAVADRSFGHLKTFLQEYFSTHLTSPGLLLIGDLDTFFPFIEGFTGALTTAVLAPIGFGVLIYYIRQVLKTPTYIGLTTIGLCALFAATDAYTAGEFWLAMAFSALNVIYFALIVFYLLRNNILAYMLAAFAAQSLSGSLHLLEQSAALYQTNGWLWLGAGILCLLALILQTRHQNQTS
jgi:hypothetical protein